MAKRPCDGWNGGDPCSWEGRYAHGGELVFCERHKRTCCVEWPTEPPYTVEFTVEFVDKDKEEQHARIRSMVLNGYWYDGVGTVRRPTV